MHVYEQWSFGSTALNLDNVETKYMMFSMVLKEVFAVYILTAWSSNKTAFIGCIRGSVGSSVFGA